MDEGKTTAITQKKYIYIYVINAYFLPTLSFKTRAHESRLINLLLLLIKSNHCKCRYQWPRGLRRRSVTAGLLRLGVRIPPGHGSLSVVSVVYCQVEVSATS